MKKYFVVMRNTWNEMLTYRVNFVAWRIRSVIQLLTMYFLWLAVLPQNAKIADYNQSLMLTYILGTSFISAVVLSSRTQEIGENINNGDLSVFLIRPINYFGFWFWKDLGDKAMNILFSVVELFLIFMILRPPFFIQTNIMFLNFFFISVLLAIILYFLLSSLLGLIGFWSQDVWAPRFIFWILIAFFAGSLFPLDILPKPIFSLFSILPFSSLLYLPLKIYLGQLSIIEIFKSLSLSVIWILVLWRFLLFVWIKGLKTYVAYGR